MNQTPIQHSDKVRVEGSSIVLLKQQKFQQKKS